MERVQNMVDYLAKDMETAMENRKQQWLELNTQPLKSKLQSFINSISELEDGTIVISYLKSSYITKSHKFKIAQYADAPFMELYPLFEYVDAKFLFDHINNDMIKLINRLENKFFRIKNSEKEEIRRYYMEWLYEESRIIFKQVILDIFSGSLIPPIYFGAELCEVRPLVEDN